MNEPLNICAFPQPRAWYCTEKCTADYFVNGRLTCACGEDSDVFHWGWEDDVETTNKILSEKNRLVLFHPMYSSGTACVRGDVPFRANRHYYWEVKMVSNLYGTDVMVGVGTSKVSPKDWRLRFCSMLGFDSESWGFSYRGTLHHNKQSRKYGCRFGIGSIIGVHLDMTAGTLQYFLNRKPLGIAFTGLKKYELYPMVSSTAAQSAVKLTCAIITEPTLLLECLTFVRNNAAVLHSYNNIPGLSQIFEKKYFWCVPPKEDKKKQKHKLELEDEVVLSRSRLGYKRKHLFGWESTDLQPMHPIYVLAKRNCSTQTDDGSQSQSKGGDSVENVREFDTSESDDDDPEVVCARCQSSRCSVDFFRNVYTCKVCGLVFS